MSVSERYLWPMVCSECAIVSEPQPLPGRCRNRICRAVNRRVRWKDASEELKARAEALTENHRRSA